MTAMRNLKPIAFMRNRLFKIVVGVAALTAVFLSSAAAQQPAMKTLPGHVPAVVSRLQAKGLLPATNNLYLAIGLPLRNREALTNLLQQIYDPASPNYHHYLTPEQFTARFGPTEEDYQKVIQFAEANGLTVTKKHGNRVLLGVTGKVSDIQKAFRVTMRTYRHPSEVRDFFAPDAEPSVAADVPVLYVSGLDNYFLPRPALHVKPLPAVKTALGSGPVGTYMGYDFRNAYAPGASQTGSGQAIGLLEFDAGYYQSDITAYEAQAGLPNVPVQPVLLDGYNGGPGSANANGEVSLDIEMAISMAPGVSQVYVFEGSTPDDILNAMAANNQIKQLSASWGYPIDATSEQIFKQFAAQGQSYFNCSGDGLAWVGSIFTPCDDPNVTVVGGTTLTTAANGVWSSETVWNWGFTGQQNSWNVDEYWGSSGGISTTYSIPAWQTNIVMTTNHGSSTFRNVPDVALTADNIYVIYGGGNLGDFGGTSAATPLWAGFMALVNQQAVANGKATLGFINPNIYALAEGTNYNNLFHDITTGNNFWPGSPNRFRAVPGYDLCTGWGTPNGTNLINALVGAASVQISAPQAPYGSTLTSLDGANPNGTWNLFEFDDGDSFDSGVISNGWILALTTANPVGAAADNQLLMTVSAGTVPVGGSSVYILTVTNFGPSVSSNVFVSETLPSGVTLVSSNATQGSFSGSFWNIGTLNTNAGAQLNLTVQLNSAGSFTSTAFVSANTPDPNPDDNSASATITAGVTAPPQLSGTATAAGGKFLFSIISAAGQTNIIETTTNLAAGPWVPIFTNIGPFIFTNSIIPGHPDVFFRDRIGP
jgi:uncharacterized repeat protein (TIGR01451 family)